MNLIQAYLDKTTQTVFSFTTEEQLLKWEETAAKVAKYAGYAIGALAIATISVLDGFPSLLSRYSFSLFLVTSMIITAGCLYHLYLQKVESLRQTTSEELITHLSDKKTFTPVEEEKYTYIGSQVKTLSLKSNTKFKALTTEEKTTFFNNIAKYFPQLTTLSMDGLNIRRNVSLEALKNLPLENLEINNCNFSTKQLAVFRAHTKLKKLSLTQCHKITSGALEHFSSSPIEELTLVHCRLDTRLNLEEANKNAVQQIMNTSSPLEQMRHKEKFVDEALEFTNVPPEKYFYLRKFKQLKQLSVSHLNDDAVVDFAKWIPTLETLQIEHSRALTGKCFERMPKDSSIKHLVLKNCYAWTNEAYTHLKSVKTLETVTFATDPAAITGLKGATLQKEYTNFRQTFKAPDKMDNTFVGTWRRKDKP